MRSSLAIRRLTVAALMVVLFVAAAEIAPVLRERSRYSQAGAELTELTHRLDAF